MSVHCSGNVNTCHITMKVISADFSCSVVKWGAKAAFTELSTGFMEASKAKPGPELNMECKSPCGAKYIRKNCIFILYIIYYFNIYSYSHVSGLRHSPGRPGVGVGSGRGKQRVGGTLAQS
jgi:hypothetical protein